MAPWTEESCGSTKANTDAVSFGFCQDLLPFLISKELLDVSPGYVLTTFWVDLLLMRSPSNPAAHGLQCTFLCIPTCSNPHRVSVFPRYCLPTPTGCPPPRRFPLRRFKSLSPYRHVPTSPTRRRRAPRRRSHARVPAPSAPPYTPTSSPLETSSSPAEFRAWAARGISRIDTADVT